MLGTTLDDVNKAISFLCDEDSRSRSTEHSGRRLLHEGGFQYLVVNHGKYRNIRSDEERREYNRIKKREERQKHKGNSDMSNQMSLTVNEMSNSPSDSDSVSVLNSSLIRGSAEGELFQPWEVEFMECWKMYPNKKGKNLARRSFKKAYEEGVRMQDVINGLDRYSAFIKSERDRGFKNIGVQHGGTWFFNRGWEDEYTTEDGRNAMPLFK
jgi:hypothetical protein